jgi:hypothetical protein
VSVPKGWDDDVPDDLIAGLREMRKVYVGLLAAGFSMNEAAAIVANMVAVNAAMNPQSGKDT